MALARAQQQRGWEAMGLKLLGDVHADEPAEVDTTRPSRPGKRTVGRSRARPNSACARPSPIVTSASQNSTGRRTREQAREHFTHATTMYREMGMQFWPGQAEVELRRLA